MKPLKAIIFDMDGVLVDSEPFHQEIERRVFRKLQLDISEEEHATYMGTATDVMWKRIREKHQLSQDIKALVDLNLSECHSYFAAREKITPMAGVVPLLEKVLRNQIPMALASSSDPKTIDLIMEKSGLGTYFNYIVSSTLVGKSKPDPAIFLYTSELLNVPPDSCVVIEDSTNGIKAAKAAGMFCVAYSNASAQNQDQTEADLRVADFNVLEDMLFSPQNRNVELN